MHRVIPDPGSVATTIVPELAVRRGTEAIEFYRRAFGAVQEYRVGGNDSNPSVVAQLSVGGARFWVSDEAPDHGSNSPERVGGSTARMLLIVEDVDRTFTQAIQAGATEVRSITEEHGWRLGLLVDPYGHHWEIGRPLIPWPPASGGPHHH